MLRSGIFIAALGLAWAAAPAQQPVPEPTASAAPAQAAAPAKTDPGSGSTQPAAASSESATGSSASAGRKHPASKRDRTEAQQLFVQGAKDIDHDKIRAAMDEFTRAAELNPAERKYEMADQIAKQHMVAELIQESDREKILGHYADARAKISEAYSVDPASPVVAQHMDELASTTVAGEPATRSDSIEAAPPIEFAPKPGVRSFHLRGSERNIISQVLPAYGIQPTIDDSVGAQTIRYDVDDADFAAARRTLQLATGSFIVPLDPGRAIVAKETRANHDKFDRLAVETVYLPGLEASQLTEIANTAKNVFALRTATTDAHQSSLTVRGRSEDLDALNATLKILLEGRSELQLDVRMYEIDRTKAVNLGAILPNQTTLFNVYSEARNVLNSNSSLVQEIISSGLAAPGDWEAILAILIASGQVSNSILTEPFGVFGGGLSLTGVAYQGGSMNMQLNSTDVRAVDQLQLHVLDRQDATIKAGERYPIETSSYSSLGASPVNIPGLSTAGLSSTLSNLGITPAQLQEAETATIPQVQYQDIGLTLKVTPNIEGTDRVSLKFDLTLSSLEGSSLNSLPILNNREYQAITSVKLGETALLTSSLSRQESDAITGIPGVSEIPGFQSTTNKDSNLDIAELAIVITPHLVRSVNRAAQERMILLPIGQPGP
jgi:general secretion pathway protein D